MRELVGSRLNQYQLHEILGEGGMAVVFRAVEVATRQEVALKVLKPGFAANSPSALKRFLVEAETAGRLNHANIVRCTGYGQARPEGKQVQFYNRPLHYLILDYVPGGTLARKLRDRGSFSLSRVEQVIGDVAKALDYAHNCGVIHRDIKPSNIMVGPNSQYKVADFGIARLLDATTRLTTTSIGFIGTALYASPEQIRGRGVDRRSDVYSLGVVAYELLTGRLPFDESRYENGPALLYALSHGQPRPIRSLKPQVPRSVEQVVMKALARQREERYESAGEFARYLKQAIPAQYAGEARPPSQPTPPIIGPGRGATPVPPLPKLVTYPELRQWWPALMLGIIGLFALLGVFLAMAVASSTFRSYRDKSLPASPSFTLTAGKPGLVSFSAGDSPASSFGCTNTNTIGKLLPCNYKVMVVGLPTNIPQLASPTSFTLKLGDAATAERYEVRLGSPPTGEAASRANELTTAQAVLVVGTLNNEQSLATPTPYSVLLRTSSAATKNLVPSVVFTWNASSRSGATIWYGAGAGSKPPSEEMWVFGNFGEGALWSVSDETSQQKYNSNKGKNALVLGHWEAKGSSYIFRLSKAYFEKGSSGEYA